VTVGTGDRATPNTRATVQEVFEGLEARSQNRWPSLAFDLMAVSDLAAPLLGAGFYYKTFMWPPKAWERLYEPLIRRAAGLGALSGRRDPDASEKAFAFADVLVIGAGPAGLMAALVAGRAGARVILADEDFRMGGRLNAERLEVDGQSGADWAAAAVAELAALPNVTLMPRTTVVGVYDGQTYGAYERVGEHRRDPPEGLPLHTFWRIHAPRAILAAGAHERMVAFPNNDRPGVMLAGAVRAYLHRWAVAPGRKAAVFTTNDDGWRTARDLADAGVAVTALIDARSGVKPPEGPWRVFTDAVVSDTLGRRGLSGIYVRVGDRTLRVDANLLAVAGGWNPAVHLTCHLGARPVWDAALSAFVPREGAVPGLAVAGAAAGVFSTHGALEIGAARAREALAALGRTAKAARLPEAEDAPGGVAPIWHVEGRGRAWVDLQNDVTVKDISLAHRENFRAAEHMKRYTTLGMATDQGKTGGVTGLAILAELAGQGVAETGTTTYRPPYTPVPVAALGAGAAGAGFAPQRYTPAHGAMMVRGAPMIEAGLWYRPSHFPIAGETSWRQACDREVRMVRSAVGVADVTTLGKIDVQGPDAAAFLDRVYANTMSSLAVGRVRYGLMLREDGFVMDDGTCARLGERHFLVTTTTAAAAQVMAHFEFVQQCLLPELDVATISVTEQWAQFAVAGPKARELIAGITEADVSVDALPFMGCVAAHVLGVRARLFRISFSGELGYEVAVPARFGRALYQALVAQADALGGGPYGMEALNVLRIEKGLLTHAELHGRTTADDLGLGRMVAAGKDCVGRALSQRPGLSGPERQQLVGLKPVNLGGRLVAGAHVIDVGDPADAGHDRGYLTSACHSPVLGHAIALGFVVNGRARVGERVRAVCKLRDIDTEAEIVALPFVDAEGRAMRG
jgi:sarcosine oxidase subunit alpha